MNRLLVALLLGTLLSSVDHAPAQDFPSRPITVIVGQAAGGPTDVSARILAERMRTFLGQSVIVENVTGASGSLGAGRVARAEPNGYVLSIGNLATHVLNGVIYTLHYNVLNDFEPVSLLSTQAMLIVAKKSMPATNLKELIAWLKENPDQALQGTAGGGSVGHISGVLFQNMTGTRMQFVPYRGAGPAMQDLVAGQIDLMIDQAPNSLPQIRAGNVKAYAVTSSTRLPSAPDIPTVDEAGLPGFHISQWQALWAPKGTPQAVIAKLNAAVVDALADATVRARLAHLGQEIFARDEQTPQMLSAFHKAEIDKWWPIVKEANVKVD